MILVEKINYQIKQYLAHLYENMNNLFNNKFPTDLCIAFKIIKLLIEKGSLNLIHNKNTYQHYNSLSRKRKLDKLYNEMIFMIYKDTFHISTISIKFHQLKNYLHFNILFKKQHN